MKQLVGILIAAMIFIIFSNCSPLEKAFETNRIKMVIVKYNEGISKSANTADMAQLKGIASEDVLRRLNLWVSAWHDAGLYMNAELKNIKFKQMEISEQTARILTHEDWLYDYRNIENRQVVIPPDRIFYEIEYVLQRQGGWIITEINIKFEGKGTAEK